MPFLVTDFVTQVRQPLLAYWSRTLPWVTPLPVRGSMTLTPTRMTEPRVILEWLTASATRGVTVGCAFAVSGAGAGSAAEASTGPAMSWPAQRQRPIFVASLPVPFEDVLR